MATQTSSIKSTPWYEGPSGKIIIASYVIVTPAIVLATSQEVSFLAVLEPIATRLTARLIDVLAVAGVVLTLVGFGFASSLRRAIETRIGMGERIANIVVPGLTLVGFLLTVYVLPVAVFGTKSPVLDSSLETTVSLDVYLFAVAGAAARLFTNFVVDLKELTGQAGTTDEPTDETNSDSDHENDERADDGQGDEQEDDGQGVETDTSGLEVAQLLLGLPAAVYLAAGVALLGDVTATLFSWADSVTFVGIVGFIVGFFVRRTYETLGEVAGRLLEPVEEDEEDEEDEAEDETQNAGGETRDDDEQTLLSRMTHRPKGEAEDEDNGGDEGGSENGLWYTGWHGEALILVVLLLVIVVALLTVEGSGVVDRADTGVHVPPDVYLYGIMGGLAYVFTTLFVEVTRSKQALLKTKFRILAGVLLAVGLYVLLSPTEGSAAPVAFLVGLFPNVAIVRLTVLGEDFFDRVTTAIKGS